MKIAILVPTRERLSNSITLLMSILSTVNDINNVNIYYGVDADDPTLSQIIKISEGIPSLNIIKIDNNNEFLGLGKLWNILVENSTEDIISMIGDDMVFKTPDWDLKILEEFENIPPDNIKAVHCDDGYHGSKLAVNLFCHREYANVLGGFMREEFKINWVDQWMHQLFSAFNRLTYRGDILIEHRHWVLGKSQRDSTVDRMQVADIGKISDKLWFSLKDERISDANKLSKHMGILPDWSKVDTRDITI